MLEPLPQWKQTFARLAPSQDVSWARALAGWVDERTTGKLALANIFGGVSFTFQKGVFLSELLRLTPTTEGAAGARAFATAWESAVQASLFLVTPGSFLGAPSPATLWSVVTSFIDPPSIAAGKALLISKLSSPPLVADAHQSIFPEAFYQATLKLTVSATGTNSLPIPTPLVAPFSPVA